MIHLVSKMTPLMPQASGDLSDLALDIYRKSASLGGQLHPITRGGLVNFVRLTNSYYSNLIEGHYTPPVDIERAMNDDFVAEPAVATRGRIIGITKALPLYAEPSLPADPVVFICVGIAFALFFHTNLSWKASLVGGVVADATYLSVAEHAAETGVPVCTYACTLPTYLVSRTPFAPFTLADTGALLAPPPWATLAVGRAGAGTIDASHAIESTAGALPVIIANTRTVPTD